MPDGADRGRAGITRRGVLLGGAGLAAIDPIRAMAESGFDWKRYKGQHIEVSLQKSPRADLLQQHQKEFEDLTGISVGAEQIPEQQHRQKFVIEFSSGHPSFDVVNLAPHVQKKLVGKTKWLEDLRPYIQDSNATSPDFDFSDFSKPSLDYATQPDGRLDMLMWNLDYQALYWNKGLFAQKGVAYPKSLAEIADVAKALHDPKRNIAGFVARGLKNANAPVWTELLLGWNVNSIDPDLTMHTDGAEAIAAAQLYQTLLKDYGPPGVSGFNWYEAQTSFVLGRAAMLLEVTGFALPFENPKTSRVVGKVGYGVVPPGPKAQIAGLTADALGIAAKSPNKGPAWLYMQWACGKQMMARQLSGGYGAPPRMSVFKMAEEDRTRRRRGPGSSSWRNRRRWRGPCCRRSLRSPSSATSSASR